MVRISFNWENFGIYQSCIFNINNEHKTDKASLNKSLPVELKILSQYRNEKEKQQGKLCTGKKKSYYKTKNLVTIQ